jgi:hypothetical protein
MHIYLAQGGYSTFLVGKTDWVAGGHDITTMVDSWYVTGTCNLYSMGSLWLGWLGLFMLGSHTVSPKKGVYNIIDS